PIRPAGRGRPPAHPQSGLVAAQRARRPPRARANRPRPTRPRTPAPNPATRTPPVRRGTAAPPDVPSAPRPAVDVGGVPLVDSAQPCPRLPDLGPARERVRRRPHRVEPFHAHGADHLASELGAQRVLPHLGVHTEQTT